MKSGLLNAMLLRDISTKLVYVCVWGQVPRPEPMGESFMLRYLFSYPSDNTRNVFSYNNFPSNIYNLRSNLWLKTKGRPVVAIYIQFWFRSTVASCLLTSECLLRSDRAG